MICNQCGADLPDFLSRRHRDKHIDEAKESLITGLRRQSPRILDNLGIRIVLSDAPAWIRYERVRYSWLSRYLYRKRLDLYYRRATEAFLRVVLEAGKSAGVDLY